MNKPYVPPAAPSQPPMSTVDRHEATLYALSTCIGALLMATPAARDALRVVLQGPADQYTNVLLWQPALTDDQIAFSRQLLLTFLKGAPPPSSEGA